MVEFINNHKACIGYRTDAWGCLQIESAECKPEFQKTYQTAELVCHAMRRMPKHVRTFYALASPSSEAIEYSQSLGMNRIEIPSMLNGKDAVLVWRRFTRLLMPGYILDDDDNWILKSLIQRAQPIDVGFELDPEQHDALLLTPGTEPNAGLKLIDAAKTNGLPIYLLLDGREPHKILAANVDVIIDALPNYSRVNSRWALEAIAKINGDISG